MENAMCDIGKPVEIIDVIPLNLPTPLRHEQPEPEQPVVPVEIPVTVEVPVGENH